VLKGRNKSIANDKRLQLMDDIDKAFFGEREKFIHISKKKRIRKKTDG